MAIITLAEPAPAEQQLRLYNQGSTGLRKADHYQMTSGDIFAFVACVLQNSLKISEIESDLVPPVEALPQVDQVYDPRFAGRSPASILKGGNYKCRIHVDAALTCKVGFTGDKHEYNLQQRSKFRPGVNKDWAILVMKLLSVPLNESDVTAIEDGIAGIAGVARAEHLSDAIVPPNATRVRLGIQMHMRIDPE